MGLLDLILGKSNPAAQFVDSNPYFAPAIGGGLASGTSLAGGFANAAQNMASAKQADLQYGLQQQQLQLAAQGRQQTADWLESQHNPQLVALAGAVRSGAISGGDVFKMIFAPGPNPPQGSTQLPNPLSPDYQGPSAQGASSATNDTSMAPPPVGPNAPPMTTQAPSTSTPITGPASAAAFYQGMTPNVPIPPATAQVASNGPSGIPGPSSVPLAPWTGTVPAAAASQLTQALAPQPSPVPLAPITPTTSAPQPGPQVAQAQPVYDPSKPFRATPTNPLYMTPQERQDLGKQWGLAGTPLTDFTVSGRMPLRAGSESPMRPATPADKAAYGISPNDPGVYMVNTATNAIQKIAGATAAVAPGSDVAPPPVELGPDGRPDPAQQAQYIKSLPAGLATMVKGVADYTIDPMRSTSIRGDQRQALITAVKQYDPTYDQTQFQARAAMRKSVTSGTYSQAINSANLVIQHLDAVAKAADGLRNTGSPLWNAVSNTVKQQTGQPQVVAFNVAADAAATELAKVFKGTGATSDSEIKAWRANLDPNSSPEQIHAAIDSAVTNLLASRLDTIRTQYASAMGKPADFRLLTNHSALVLKDLGVDTSALDPNATSTPATTGNTTSSGVKWSIAQ